MKSLFLVFMSCLIFGAIYLVYRNGVFLPVTFEVKTDGPFYLLGSTHIGPYHQVLPTLKKVEEFAKSVELPCQKTFGEYIDDPNIVEVERLQSFLGCVLSEPTVEQLPDGFKLSERPARKYLVGSFKGSPALGPYKAYKDAAEFMARRGLVVDGPVIEIYDIDEDQSMTTLYYFPLK